ncbi:MAG: hypothetical protein JNK67_01605 [Alphaproteobacteria bacterium]|nr:hypothetical protein [Alphaproteobacteria bacterium]
MLKRFADLKPTLPTLVLVMAAAPSPDLVSMIFAIAMSWRSGYAQLVRGEVGSVVGETGSGKSLAGLSAARLVPFPRGRDLRGSIRFDGFDVPEASVARIRQLRGTMIGFVSQDPTADPNPSFASAIGCRTRRCMRSPTHRRRRTTTWCRRRGWTRSTTCRNASA